MTETERTRSCCRHTREDDAKHAPGSSDWCRGDEQTTGVPHHPCAPIGQSQVTRHNTGLWLVRCQSTSAAASWLLSTEIRRLQKPDRSRLFLVRTINDKHNLFSPIILVPITYQTFKDLEFSPNVSDSSKFLSHSFKKATRVKIFSLLVAILVLNVDIIENACKLSRMRVQSLLFDDWKEISAN